MQTQGTLFYKVWMLTCYRLSGRKILPHTTSPPMCGHQHSTLSLWSTCTQSFIYSPALQCPLPHHSIKDCFPLSNLTDYMRFSTEDEKLTQVLPGPPAKIPHGSRKWLDCLAALLPSALLSPSGIQGASTTYWSLCWDQEYIGEYKEYKSEMNPLHRIPTPSASGKLKKKKVPINKRQRACKS